MAIEESVTQWIDQLREGNTAAAQRLWEAYYQRMVLLARQRLDGVPRQMADEEDVALSAFKSFCVGAQNGRFTQLTDRTNLWPLLIAITANKAVDLIRYHNRSKRGGGAVIDGVDFERAAEVSLDEVFSKSPTPEFSAEVADEFNRLLECLKQADDPELSRIAIWKMDGDTNGEIAERLGCTLRTVQRRLRLIASFWSSGAGG